jgi:outer membrane protein TolC
MVMKMKLKMLIFLFASLFFILTETGAAEVKPGLEQCIEKALQNNHDYIAQQKKVEETGFKLFQQITNVLPQFDSSASYYRYEYELPSKKALFGISNDDYYADISLKQILFAGGKNIGLISSAAASNDAEKAKLESIKRNIIYSVKKAYYDLAKTVFAYDTQKELYEKLKAQANIAQILYSGGKISNLELLKIQTQVLSTGDSLRNLQELKGIKELILGQAMGVSETVDVQIDIPEPSENEKIKEIDEAIWINNNPEIIYFKKLVDKADSEITTARADFFPSIYIRANYFMEDKVFFPGNPNWYAGVALTIPVFHWGGIFAQVKQAEARKEQVSETQKQTELAILIKYRSAKASFYEKKDRFKTMKKIIELSKQALDTAELKYNSGKLSVLELIDAQTVWFNAVLNYKNVIVEYYMAKADLETIYPDAIEEEKNENQ